MARPTDYGTEDFYDQEFPFPGTSDQGYSEGDSPAGGQQQSGQQWTDSGKPDCGPGKYARYIGPYDAQGNATGGADPGHWECVSGGGGGGGGGGAPSGGGGGGGAAKKKAAPGSTFDPSQYLNIGADINKFIEEGIMKGGTRFTPEVVQRLQGDIQRQEEGLLASELDKQRYEGALSGTGRSPAMQRGAQQAIRASGARESSRLNELEYRRVLTEFQDRLASLDRAEQHLNNMRQYVATLAGLSVQKDSINAQMTLGFARINAERENLLTSLAQQNAQFTASFGLQQQQQDFFEFQNTVPIQLPNGQIVNVPLSQVPIYGGF